jgi:hypothetical protein
MKAQELDCSQDKPHYFDLMGGEVLVGQSERKRLINDGADPNFIFDLGPLLRDPDPFIDPDQMQYEPLDTTEWPRERYIRFAKWLDGLVEPPDRPEQKRVNQSVFSNARRLGLGPGRYMIQKEFGTYSELYAESGLEDCIKTGFLADWEIEDAIAYVKKVGGGSRPGHQDLDRFHQRDPRNPAAKSLGRRFRHIGGFSKLAELAGYTVVKLWGRDDYINWGARFMQANDGQAPTARMMRYMASIKRGPSEIPLSRHFEGVRDFQEQARHRFDGLQKEKERLDAHHLDIIGAELRAGRLPLTLFSPLPFEDGQDSIAAELEVLRAYSGIGKGDMLTAITDELGVSEVIRRYAKYRVTEILADDLSLGVKLKIARGLYEHKTFVGSIRHHKDVLAGEIESEALFLGAFDYIWPMDEHVSQLKLDKGYERFCETGRKSVREANRRKRALTAA